MAGIEDLFPILTPIEPSLIETDVSQRHVAQRFDVSP